MELIAYVGSLLFSGILYSVGLYAFSLPFKISSSIGIGIEGKLVAYLAAVIFGLMLLYAGTYNLLKSRRQRQRHKSISKLYA